MTKKKAPTKKKPTPKKAAPKKKPAPKKKGRSASDAKRKPGRPQEYDRLKIMGVICTRLVESPTAALHEICSADSDLPNEATIYRWLAEDGADPKGGQLCEMYARAREGKADRLASEILDIADEASMDFTEDKDGNPVVDHEHIQRSRLRVDSRKWLAAKLAPRKYGDAVNLKHSGEVKTAAPTFVLNFGGKPAEDQGES